MPKLLDQTSMTGIRSLVTPLYVCEFMMILSFHLCTKKIYLEKKNLQKVLINMKERSV
jgi:hypothetical protein